MSFLSAAPIQRTGVLSLSITAGRPQSCALVRSCHRLGLVETAQENPARLGHVVWLCAELLLVLTWPVKQADLELGAPLVETGCLTKGLYGGVAYREWQPAQERAYGVHHVTGADKLNVYVH